MRSVSRDELHLILERLARVGALATRADSCFIFLLASFPEVEHVVDLELIAFHSSHTVVHQAFIERHDQSPIGWIGLHAMPLNLPSVEDPKEFAEVYENPVEIKSFFGVPIILPGENTAVGVVACDSQIEKNFSRLQIGLVEQLAAHISDLLLKQRLGVARSSSSINSWDDFTQKVEELVKALGRDGIDIIRLSSLNFTDLERTHGLYRAVDLVDQFEALVQQSVPPQFPIFRLPNGDVILVLDKMMVDFVEKKIQEILDNLRSQGRAIYFGSIGRIKSTGRKNASIEEILAEASLSTLPRSFHA